MGEAGESPYTEIEGETEVRAVRGMSLVDWLQEPQFYQIAGVYMATRLFVNLSQAYLPLYLLVSLQLSSQFVAIIPLVLYSAGFLASRAMKPLNRVLGRKISFVLGAGLGLAACTWVYLAPGSQYGEHEELGGAEAWYRQFGIFLVAGLLGTAGSALLITSLSLTAELIGPNTESSGFVYGAMSFTDKAKLNITQSHHWQ